MVSLLRCIGCFFILAVAYQVCAVEHDESKHPLYRIKSRMLEIGLQKDFKPLEFSEAEKILYDLEIKQPVFLLKSYPFFDFVSLISQPQVDIELGQRDTQKQGQDITLKTGEIAFVGTKFKTEIRKAHLNFIELYVDLYKSQLPREQPFKALHLRFHKELILHENQWLSQKDLLQPTHQKRLVSRRELRNILMGQAAYQGESLILWQVYAQFITPEEQKQQHYKKQQAKAQ